ncbi:hypothetical protein PM082_022843 [Marasmius tenuissimus]|nr:hypothetical protein PM082_022843 [Marasmius tenuissimus]
MAAHKLTLDDLLRNIPLMGFNGEISYADGLVACLHPGTHKFVTSPNVSSILPPPFGSTRDLYCHEDGFYGQDDPVLCPQPFNSHHPYLPWVSSPPSSDSHPYKTHACRERREGVICPRFKREIETTNRDLRERAKQYRQLSNVNHVDVGQLLCEFNDTLTVWFNRITTVSMGLKDIKLGLSEVQRAWLYSSALLDWLEAAKGQHNGQATPDLDPHHCMGAFVWTDQHALYLWRNNVPVYYIRPYGTFDRQVILSVQCFLELAVCDSPTTPPYPVILANCQASADRKFAALRGAATTCYMSSSPFENMHLPGAYVHPTAMNLLAGSSLQLVPRPPCLLPILSPLHPPGLLCTTRQRIGILRTPQTNLASKGKKDCRTVSIKILLWDLSNLFMTAPQEQRSLYADITHPLLPPPLTLFAGLNALIYIHHPCRRNKTGKAPRLATIVPDPAVFTGPKDQTKRDIFLRGWQAFRSS